MRVVRVVLAHWVLMLLVAGCSSPGGPGPQSRAAAAAEPVRAAVTASSTEEYRLGAGDVISIRVYGGEEDIRLEKIRLDNSGSVTLPFGQFEVRGRTTKEVEAAILKTVAGRIIKQPRVWVNVDEYRPFYVEGQVSRPGAYPYQPGLNVRRAVTIAGGFRERAALDKIFIVPEDDRKGTPIKANLNTLVAPGDTITVQESFF